jgi:hypothetical protein
MNSMLKGSRRVERELQWMDDLKKLAIQRWWMVTKDGESWKRILQKAEAYCGL